MVVFASLNEVYGDDFTRKYEEKNISHKQLTQVAFDKDPTPLFLREKRYNNEDCFKDVSQKRDSYGKNGVKSFNSGNMQSEFNNSQSINNERRYQELREKGERERFEQINSMNVIERPLSNEELMKKYNNNDLTKRNILMERLKFLEDQMNTFPSSQSQGKRLSLFSQEETGVMNKKYGSDINQNQIKIKENINQGNIQQENFTNSSFAPVNQYQMHNNNLNQEFIDLFFLIVMGLILLYIFESIYKFGKMMGARGK